MIPTTAQIDRAEHEVWRGKTNTERYHRYRYYREDHNYRMQAAMCSPDFAAKPMGIKHIEIPKPRTVQVPSVRDKIIMHALCDNVIYSAVEAKMGPWASACLIGRGTEYGTARAEYLLRRWWKEHHSVPYILKGDIHTYFASVRRDRILELSAEILPDEDIRRISRAYTLYDDSPVGMPLGLQQSQCFGNLYLAALDDYIVQERGFANYGRHMDDFYVLAATHAELEDLLNGIRDKLAEIGLELNPKTTIERGRLDYLGFTHIITDDGKYLLRLLNGKKKAKKRELKMVVRGLTGGHLTPEKVQLRYQGWRQRILRAGCRNVVIEMDRHFICLLHNAGYKTRTTMKKGVEIIGKSNKHD